MSNFSAPRPSDPRPVQHREEVAGACSECGAEALQAYPVLSEGGWFNAVKCQQCLASNRRDPAPRLGYITLLTDDL